MRMTRSHRTLCKHRSFRKLRSNRWCLAIAKTSSASPKARLAPADCSRLLDPRPCGQRDQRFHAIGLIFHPVCRFVGVQCATFRAAMQDHKARFWVRARRDRLHSPAALTRAVTGIDVHVQAPQAKGTMIARGHRKRLHRLAAVRADKSAVVFFEIAWFP